MATGLVLGLPRVHAANRLAAGWATKAARPKPSALYSKRTFFDLYCRREPLLDRFLCSASLSMLCGNILAQRARDLLQDGLS